MQSCLHFTEVCIDDDAQHEAEGRTVAEHDVAHGHRHRLGRPEHQRLGSAIMMAGSSRWWQDNEAHQADMVAHGEDPDIVHLVTHRQDLVLILTGQPHRDDLLLDAERHPARMADVSVRGIPRRNHMRRVESHVLEPRVERVFGAGVHDDGRSHFCAVVRDVFLKCAWICILLGGFHGDYRSASQSK